MHFNENPCASRGVGGWWGSCTLTLVCTEEKGYSSRLNTDAKRGQRHVDAAYQWDFFFSPFFVETVRERESMLHHFSMTKSINE